MKKTIITAFAAMLLCIPSFSTETTSSDEAKETKKKKEVTYNEKGEIIKTGTNFGPLPVVAFDADRGFQFGALLNLYNFGNGDTYPNPKSQWYFEASAYTKEGSVGSYKFIVNYDNKTLIPGVRMSICSGYYKDAALDFYGFNGYQSNYIPSKTMFEDGMASYLPDEAGEKLQEKGPCNIIYEIVSTDGPVHHCLFEMQVVANGKILGKGSAYSKKEAQQKAACDALNKIG